MFILNRINTLSYRTMLIVLLFALVAYAAPWVSNPSTGLTIGAYDLAEWASLSPAQRSTNPPLLISFLLRLQLLLLTVLVAATVPRSRGRGLWAGFVIVVLLVIAQMPPLEFVNHITDVNYQQQFSLAVISLILALLAWRGLAAGWSGIMSLLLVLSGSVTSLVGLSYAQALMHDYHQPARTGLGFYAMLVVYAVLLYLLLHQKRVAYRYPLRTRGEQHM